MRQSLVPLLFLLTGTVNAAVAIDGAPIEENFHTCDNLQCGSNTVKKFHMENKLLTGPTVYGETFYAEQGRSDEHATMFTPIRIIQVYNPGTGEIYKEPEDYLPTKEGITLTPGSRIKRAPFGFSDQITDVEKNTYGVRVTTEFQSYQYAITYDKKATLAPHIYGDLGGFQQLIGTKPLSITFYGDSITLGANATSIYTPPNQPGYAGLVMAYLSETYPGMWLSRNTSVGGWSSKDAIKAVDYRVLDKKSDLVVIAFGMNDESIFSAAKYKNNLEKLIDTIRLRAPDVPIMLVSPIRANPKAIIQKKRNVDDYLPALESLQQKYSSVAVADVTSIWDVMLRKKAYLDVTGNGLNHPNDFAHRIIAEVVLSAILSEKY
ncbi:SGNH/GDSL hydrolase family protein [Pseudomonas sp. NPDC096950]|uniref:SGNH/GDSL hydrolase family protein n=1 Tax=Pseudomonas sp. NPDC096950 TaxID=3364485 RepID=UPI00383B3E70